MMYLTKGDFISALKDFSKIEEKMNEWANKYHNLYYLRYEKVRSPLDYDVVGYKNGEPIRQIKSGGSFNQERVMAYNEMLDADIEKALDKYSDYKTKNENTLDDLKRIEEPLRSILVLHYKERKTLKEVCKKYKKKLVLDEVGMHRYIQNGLDKYYEI